MGSSMAGACEGTKDKEFPSKSSLGKLSTSHASLAQNNATSCRTSVQNVGLWGTVQIRILAATVNTLPHTNVLKTDMCSHAPRRQRARAKC